MDGLAPTWTLAMTEALDLESWKAPPGLLQLYEDYWSPTTDAPRVYHIASGLTVLSTIIGGRVYLPFGGDRIRPNLWSLLLGPSSFFRKTSCLNKARKTISRLHDQYGAHSPLLPDEFSREALLRRLGERSQGLLTFSEFSGALAVFGRDYMAGTRELLADLYDSPELYTRVVGNQECTLREVCLSILAASQTDWFLEKVKQADIRGGFLARFTFWPAARKATFLALPPPPDEQVGEKLMTGLNELRGIGGAAMLTPEVVRFYGAWLEDHERELQRTSRIADMSVFWSRLSITTLKFALLLQLATDRNTTIGADSLHRAIALTEALKNALRWLFESELAFTEDMRNRQKILRTVQRRPGIGRRELLRSSSLLLTKLEPIIRTLTAEGVIEYRDRGYWPSVVSDGVSEGRTDGR